jgi:HEAT repeat protein
MGMEKLAAGLGDLTRNREALALLILQGERAVPVLTEILLSPASSIPEPRCLAAEALGAIAGDDAVGALIRALTAHNVRELDPVLRLAEEAVRNRAAEQLGKIGDRRAVEPLLFALAHGGVREAMGALARFGETRAIPAIVRRLEDPCDRAAAAETLQAFGGAAIPALMAALTEHRPSAAEEAPMSIERRAEAIRLLGSIGDRWLAEALCSYLEDPAPAVHLEAALALANWRGAATPHAAVAALTHGLEHPSVPMQMRCVDALVSVGDPGIPVILSLAGPRRAATVMPRQPGDDTMLVLAVEILERIGSDDSFRAMEGFLRDPSALVRQRSRRALHPYRGGDST